MNQPHKNRPGREATLYRMVMHDHVCPFGLKSKDLLEREGWEVDDRWLTTREETDAFQDQHEVDTTPQAFIGGERIGGYDDLLEYFGKPVPHPDATSYRPVIAIFSTAFLLALATSWAATDSLLNLRTLEWFVAFAMCLLGLQKLKDLESFSNMFLTTICSPSVRCAMPMSIRLPRRWRASSWWPELWSDWPHPSRCSSAPSARFRSSRPFT